MTKEEAIRKHRILWNAIADETEKRRYPVDKPEVFRKYFVGEKIPLNYCFLCEYNRYNVNDCDNCLLERNKEESWTSCLGGLFIEWCSADSWQECARIAREIANLPERGKAGVYENQQRNGA